MALMAEQGHWHPPVITSAISLILILWSLYALSGAGIILRLPLLRFALVVISAVFLIRAVCFFWLMPFFPGNSQTFWLVSSAICLVIGILYAAGTYQSWQKLSR